MKKNLGWPLAAVVMAFLFLSHFQLAQAAFIDGVSIIQWIERDSAPAWVQAIGSVVAIIAAGGIAIYQASHARRLERDGRKATEVQRLSVVASLMARSYGLAKDVVTAFRDPSDYHFSVIDPTLMRDTAETLRSLPLFDIPSGMAAIDVRATARYLTHLADNWDELTKTIRDTNHPPEEADVSLLVSFCEELMSITKDALDACKEGIAVRGGTWS